MPIRTKTVPASIANKVSVRYFNIFTYLLGGTVYDVRDDLKRLKEMGVDHAILQLIEPDLDLVIDIAKQVSKSVK